MRGISFVSQQVEPEDLVHYGLIPELIGRLPALVGLKDLSHSELLAILVEPKNSLIKQYKKLFELEGIELKFTKTWTDYLDDVSTSYVSQDVLIAENGILAWNLSNRTGEFLDTEPLNWDDGVQRGDPADKDWFIVGGITLARNLIRPPFGWKGVACPAFQ